MEHKIYDLAVIGGGLAGFCAAVSAARCGMQVVLVQDRPVLGGNSSSEIRVSIGGACDFNPWARETGILEEFFLQERRQDPRKVWVGEIPSIWDVTLYSLAQEEKNLTLMLNTHIDEVETDGKGKIVSVSGLTLGNEKKVCIQAELFADATGDGTVAAKAGAEYRIGREGKKEFSEELAPDEPDDFVMGSTLTFHTEDAGSPVPFIRPSWVPVLKTNEDFKNRTHDDIKSGYWWIEVGNPPYHTIDENQEIQQELYKQLLAVWDHIKNQDDHGADNLHIDFIGAVPGKRESRRVVGDYIMTEQDIRKDSGFFDSVAYGGWFCDLHTPGGILKRDEIPEPSFTSIPEEVDRRQMNIYSIPLRSLYSKDISNLFLAGRDISVTHVAFGSVRLMATCSVIGQAVGTAAALCRKKSVTPRVLAEKYMGDVQQQLLKDDCYIPNIQNMDPDDVIRGSSVTASSQAVLKFSEGEIAEEYEHPKQRSFDRSGLETERSQLFPYSSEFLEHIDVLLESSLTHDTSVEAVLYSADSVIDFSLDEKLKTVTVPVPADSKQYIRLNFNIDVKGKELLALGLKSEKGVYWMYADNPPTGTVSATRIIHKWKTQKGSYTLKLYPESMPYAEQNVLSGTARPEKWTNIWISDPKQPLPAWIQFDFDEVKLLNTIYLTFDTNLNYAHMGVPGLYTAPECVKEYVLFGRVGDSWEKLLSVDDNYHRRRVHKLDKAVETDALRLEVYGTNGDASARLYEMRAYYEE